MAGISVIIPVRNNFDALRVCLNALEKQTHDRDDFEIIVVDNGSQVSCGSIKTDYPCVKWLHEERPGSYCARNHGLQNSTGRIVAFTDADCIPDANWLKNAVQSLEATGATLLGGKIEFLNSIGRKLNVYEIIEDAVFDMADHRNVVETQKFAMTANLITYRAVMERVGMFDDTLLSSGDREWGQRAVARGEILKYAESAIIRHPRRSSFSEVCGKLRRVVGGKVQLAIKRRRTDGLKPIFIQLYTRSIFNIEIYKFVWHCEKAKALVEKIRLFVTIMVFFLCTTIEGILVALGKKPYRG